MDKNVMIPQSLLTRIYELLLAWDVAGYEQLVRDGYDDIINALELKMRKLELRESYSKIVLAKDEDSRDWARMEYLREKELLKWDYSVYGQS